MKNIHKTYQNISHTHVKTYQTLNVLKIMTNYINFNKTYGKYAENSAKNIFIKKHT